MSNLGVELSSAADQFSSSTSMHGFSHLDPASPKLRLFWLCVIFIASVGTIFHLQGLIRIYLEYDSYTTVKSEQLPLVFPDVTLCSSFGLYDVALARNKMEFFTVVGLQFTKSLSDYITKVPMSNRDKNMFLSGETYFATLPRDLQFNIGLRLDDFVLNCKFQGVNCSEVGEFILYKHFIHYNCYTFRYFDSVGNEKVDILSGPQNGLSIILVGNRLPMTFYDHDNNIANVLGLRIAVHEEGTIPPILNNGIDIHPGQSTSIALTSTKYHRLNQPYGKCYEEDPGSSFLNQTMFTYSETLCNQVLSAQKIYDQCHCVSVKYHNSGRSNDNSQNCFNLAKFAQNMADSIEKALCENSFSSVKLQETTFPECVWPCQGINYDMRLSNTKWPAPIIIDDFIDEYVGSLPCTSSIKWYYETLFSFYKNLSSKCENNLFLKNYTKFYTREMTREAFKDGINGKRPSPEPFINATLRPMIDESLTKPGSLEEAKAKWIGKYFYRVNVYFRQSTTEHYRQVASMSFTDLLSGVGGVLSLWVGFSAITLIEIFVFLGNIFAISVDPKTTPRTIHVK